MPEQPPPSIDATPPDPRELLSQEVRQTIDSFVAKNKGNYIPFNPENPSAHYQDCGMYSTLLQSELQPLISTPVNILTIGVGEKIIEMMGVAQKIPERPMHAALLLEVGGKPVVVEPQTGVVTYYLDRDGLNNAQSYYGKQLKVDPSEITFMRSLKIEPKS